MSIQNAVICIVSGKGSCLGSYFSANTLLIYTLALLAVILGAAFWMSV